jgi:F-type H+-transporting ATPase subunit b
VSINLTFPLQMITFAVFVWFCWKFIWPPVINAMRERQKTIADGLEAAEKAKRDLAAAQERATEQIQQAKEEAKGIIEQARGRAVQMIEEAKDDARKEGERVKEGVRAEIAQDVNRAKETLRAQVAALAVQGAERILESSIDRDRHAKLLDKLAAEL